MMPVAWELLLESDQELAAAACKLSHRINYPPHTFSLVGYIQCNTVFICSVCVYAVVHQGTGAGTGVDGKTVTSRGGEPEG